MSSFGSIIFISIFYYNQNVKFMFFKIKIGNLLENIEHTVFF